MNLLQEIGLKLKSLVRRPHARELLEKRPGLLEGFFRAVAIGIRNLLKVGCGRFRRYAAAARGGMSAHAICACTAIYEASGPAVDRISSSATVALRMNCLPQSCAGVYRSMMRPLDTQASAPDQPILPYIRRQPIGREAA